MFKGIANGDKIRIGRLNPPLWWAHRWAEMLRQPCFLGDTQQRGQNQSTKKIFPMVSLILPTFQQTAPTEA